MTALVRASRLLRTAATVPLTVAGVGVAVQSGYLAALSLAALRRPHVGPAPAARSRLVVLVPAHDEQALIGRLLASLEAQRYPAELRRTVVIADNCTDRTAELARAAGAEVLERSDATALGKGHALRWAMDRLLERGEPFDAFVLVDADTVVDPELLLHLAAAHEAGAAAVQGEYLALEDGDGDRAALRSAAFLLFHRVRFRGRAALGLPCSLVGNGMLLSRELVRQHPWQAFSSTEDLEHSLDLRVAGVRPVFAEQARLRAPVAAGGAAARTQRTRWEGGRLELVRTRLPGLLRAVRGGRTDLWDAALDLSVPPLGVLGAAVVAGTGTVAVLVAAGALDRRALLPWAFATAAVPTHVLVGLRAAEAPASTYAALRHAPALVASEVVSRVGVLRDRRAGTWTRTERPGEVDGPAA